MRTYMTHMSDTILIKSAIRGKNKAEMIVSIINPKAGAIDLLATITKQGVRLQIASMEDVRRLDDGN